MGRFEEILDHWIDGEATPDEAAELENLLRCDPARRRAMVEAVSMVADLHDSPLSPAGSRPFGFLFRSFNWAAALLIAITAGVLVLLVSTPDLPPVVTRHERVPLGDGSEAEFAPGAKGVVRGTTAELVEGSGRFRVGLADRAVRVVTPVGEIRGAGAEFNAELRTSPLTLVVSVTVGTVEVNVGGRVIAVAAGESRKFRKKGEKGQQGKNEGQHEDKDEDDNDR